MRCEAAGRLLAGACAHAKASGSLGRRYMISTRSRESKRPPRSPGLRLRRRCITAALCTFQKSHRLSVPPHEYAAQLRPVGVGQACIAPKNLAGVLLCCAEELEIAKQIGDAQRRKPVLPRAE